MEHSATYRRWAKNIEVTQALDQRVNESIEIGDHYTDKDRKIAEQLEAQELLRAFLAEEI